MLSIDVAWRASKGLKKPLTKSEAEVLAELLECGDDGTAPRPADTKVRKLLQVYVCNLRSKTGLGIEARYAGGTQSGVCRYVMPEAGRNFIAELARSHWRTPFAWELNKQEEIVAAQLFAAAPGWAREPDIAAALIDAGSRARSQSMARVLVLHLRGRLKAHGIEIITRRSQSKPRDGAWMWSPVSAEQMRRAGIWPDAIAAGPSR